MLAYALTIFLSAFLLFQIQPLIGKAILPWFGGAPAVWTTCMLFFQLLLLGGYAYAHALASLLTPRAQRRVHVALLALALAGLALATFFWKSPILPGPGWKPSGPESPVLRILAVLLVCVGLPYFLLATTGPLLQAWFARERPGVSPYRLYALSNAGSLLALLTYPFAVEPKLTLHAQALAWAGGFVLFAAGCALLVFRSSASGEASVAAAASAASVEVAAAEVAPTVGRRLLWLGLSACASVMLLATTNQLCQEVAAIPFLWVLPLCLYLFSFILCFENDRIYRRGLFGPALALGIGAVAYVLNEGFSAPLALQVAVYAFALFACCMVCHGELVRLKPGPRHLTAFYLMVAAGGASGGLLVGVVAPRVFDGFWEYHVGLFLAGLLAVVVLLQDGGSWLRAGRPWPALAVMLAFTALALKVRESSWLDAAVAHARGAFSSPGQAAFSAGGLLLLAVLLALTRAVWWRRGRPVFAAACLSISLGLLGAALAADIEGFRNGAVSVTRNFYGVLTVEEQNKEFPDFHLLRLRHGHIVHGFQYQSPEKRHLATSYYSDKSGIGLAILLHPHRELGLRMGVVGLGVGTIATFARLGDTVRFYDINPDVVRLSLGPHRVFTYVADCMGKVEVVQGDARLSLERELAQGRPQRFDVLAIDAFSSDSIPVHLLTREAISVYLSHLARPDGILAVHISNRYLDLEPVVKGLAEELHLDASFVYVEDGGVFWGSTWILLSPEGDVLQRSGIDENAEELDAEKHVRLWTDDYSNLFQVLKK
ncbi:MAG TPA: ferrichrome ABC transporter permease [Thermoanaerobaculia bacterium]|nr:ferrichrome ABC transporter permease [Thermoanaerobaculia bacterium]